MLSFLGERNRFCDRQSRRSFLQTGVVAGTGISLSNLLRAEAATGKGSRPKSLINIYLPGGPPHIDMFDMKPEAPVEVRGSFNPIATSVPGFQICEHLPRLAAIADKYSIVRSITGLNEEHRPNQSDSGWSEKSLQSFGGRPGVGAIVAKVQGPNQGCPLTSVAMGGHTSPGFLGPSWQDFNPDGRGQNNLKLNLDESRLRTRAELLGSLDQLRRATDNSGMMEAMDTFSQQAIEVVTSPKMAEAFQIEQEDPIARAQFGETRQDTPMGRQNSRFVIARRLIEAGVRVVSFSWSGWDTHTNNFKTLEERLPHLDRTLSTLLLQLEVRGLLEDTLVMMSGEFGRTPKINTNAGRDHWASASFVFLAGGGLRPGQVIGATDRWGAKVTDRPLSMQNVFATLYRQLGIDTATTQFIDPAGRPQYFLDERESISELI